ncbi:MAG TPA: ATP synthase F0 subunit B, partial [Gemmataceae bacterium]|nr:ATP synthase F0 subunit B [Gemmataceae bacterium]
MRGDWFWKVAAVLVLIDATAGSVCAAGTDIFSLRFDLGLWSIVVFLGLYFILKKAAWGPILKGLQKRESDIRVAVEEAKLAREETKQRQAEFERKFAEAQAEIPKLMEEGRRAALALKEEMRSQAQQENQ